MATIYSPNIVTRGLKLYLDASNVRSYSGSGSTWSDLSGNGNNCVFSATPTYNTTHFTFNGTSHQGTITNNSTLNFSDEQTLIMLLRHNISSGRRNPWDQAYGGYGTWTHEDGGAINHFFGDAGANNTPYVGLGSPSITKNVWNFVCTTRDTAQQTWIFNTSVGSPTSHSYGTLLNTSANITIGNGYAGYWQGDMAIVIAYTKALTSTEVLQNFYALRGRFGI
jgi:hypothetical protein